MNYHNTNTTQAREAQAQDWVEPTPNLALEEYAKELSGAILRTRAARFRVCDASDRLFGPVPESPCASSCQPTEMSIGGLIHDLHDELNALEFQVRRL